MDFTFSSLFVCLFYFCNKCVMFVIVNCCLNGFNDLFKILLNTHFAAWFKLSCNILYLDKK